ncbi:hypothetical protein ABBQ32_008528 [Trebouxia sp. C0010 RCD-2024]
MLGTSQQSKHDAIDRQLSVAGATQRALTTLYSRNLLPANPFPLLAEVVEAVQHGGPVILTKKSPDLAGLSQYENAWGLPHVLVCVCRKGIEIIRSVVAADLPRSFYPTFRPSDPDSDGYTVEVLPSLQGRCISYQPDWQPFPLLEVRADVVVVGPDPTRGCIKLARLVVRDLTDMSAQGHYVQALVLQAPPQADGSAPTYTPLSMDVLSASDESISQLLQPGIQSGSCIVCSMVVALQVPQQRPWGKGTKEWRHLPATKSYHLHAGVQATPAILSSNLPPIDSFTVALHDALFSGLFLQEAAARRYISLHKTTPPYSQIVPNMTAMLQQMTLNYFAGQVLWAFHTLMLLTYLLDPRLSGTAPQQDPTPDPNASAKAALGLEGLVQLLDLVIEAEEQEHATAEKLVTADTAFDSESESGTSSGSESEPMDEASSTSAGADEAPGQTPMAPASSAAALGPLLIRMLSGVAASLAGAAEELQSLQWLLGQLQTQPALPPSVQDRLMTHTHSLLTRILQLTTEVVPEGPRAVVQGLLSEALQPLAAAAEQAASSFAPDSPADAASMLAALVLPVARLQSLLTGIAMTEAQALMHRAPGVRAFASQLKVDLHLLDIKTGGEASPWIAPDYTLDVSKEADKKQQASRCSYNTAVEEVQLQYAVDTRLHEALQDLHQVLTRPSIPINPFPRLTRLFLEYGCRLNLWDNQLDDASLMWNEMVRLPGTDSMYKARPASTHKQAPKLPAIPSKIKRAPRQTTADGQSAVFGCYAAVAAANAEAVHVLAEKLPYFFRHRSWQSGAYQVDVIPACTGDASCSNVFALHRSRSDAAASSTASAAPKAPTRRCRQTVPAYLHERGFGIVTEHHYLVEGPNHSEAVRLFVAALQKWLADTQLHTEHVINSLQNKS